MRLALCLSSIARAIVTVKGENAVKGNIAPKMGLIQSVLLRLLSNHNGAGPYCTFLGLCLWLDDVCINHPGFQVSAFFSWSDETRDVDILQDPRKNNEAKGERKGVKFGKDYAALINNVQFWSYLGCFFSQASRLTFFSGKVDWPVDMISP